MRKISRIKLNFAALPVIIIILLFFMRWNEYSRSYKSLANWGKGNVRTSEIVYFSNRVRSVVTKWQKACNDEGNIKDPNTTFLHIDLGKNAIWLEENGHIDDDNYINLPENITWQLNDSAKKLPEGIILRTKRANEEIKSAFFLLYINNLYKMFFGFDTRQFQSVYFNRGTATPFSLEAPNIGSLIVSQEEYHKNKDLISEANIDQSNENKDSEKTVLQENITRWLKAEKYLYMEIDEQIQNAGYELSSLEVQIGPDYTAANAIIEAHSESILNKYLNTDWGNITVRAYFKIDYLGDGIWYAKTSPHPKSKLQTDAKLDLEFLIFPFEQITRSQYKKYIKQGRKLQQS